MYSSVSSWVRSAAESARPALTPALMVSLILSANSSKADRLFIGNITPTGRFLLVTTTASRCAESRNAPKAFCASFEEIVFTFVPTKKLVVNGYYSYCRVRFALPRLVSIQVVCSSANPLKKISLRSTRGDSVGDIEMTEHGVVNHGFRVCKTFELPEQFRRLAGGREGPPQSSSRAARQKRGMFFVFIAVFSCAGSARPLRCRAGHSLSKNKRFSAAPATLASVARPKDGWPKRSAVARGYSKTSAPMAPDRPRTARAHRPAAEKRTSRRRGISIRHCHDRTGA